MPKGALPVGVPAVVAASFLMSSLVLLQQVQGAHGWVWTAGVRDHSAAAPHSLHLRAAGQSDESRERLSGGTFV